MDFVIMLAMFAVATVAVFVLTGSGARPRRETAVPVEIGEFKRDRRSQTGAPRGPNPAWMVTALADARARTMAGGRRLRAHDGAVPEEVVDDATTRVFGR